MFYKVLAVARKELQMLIKDKSTLFVLFILPLLLASLLGTINTAAAEMATGGEGEEEKSTFSVYLVNLDDGEYGKQISEMLQGVDILDIESIGSIEEADNLVGKGERMAAIVIPAGFTEKVDAYQSTNIQVIIDPVQQIFAGYIVGIVRNVAAMVNLQGEIWFGVKSVIAESGILEGAPPEVLLAVQAQAFGSLMTQLSMLEDNAQISVVSEKVSGEAVDAPWNPFTYYVPAFTVMFAFFLVGVVAATMLAEKEDGSLRRLLAAPIHRGVIIGGKILAYMLVVCAQVVVLFGVGSGIFGMPLGDIAALAALTIVLSFTATALGILVAGISRTRKQADTTGMILGFVLAGLGGCIFPFYNLEGIVGIISRLTPHAHAVLAYSQVMNDGASLVSVLPQVAILLVFGIAFFLIGLWRFKFE